MSDPFARSAGVAALDIDDIEGADDLNSLLLRRRSIRKLRSGPFGQGIRSRLYESIRLTPSAYNAPSWHVVFVVDDRSVFWHRLEEAIRERLDGDRLERYFSRIDGFRDGVAVALIFEDIAVRGQLREAWQISDEQAWAFAEQGIGMVQLSLWLALTAEGLATSLQHWEWLIGDCLMDFSGLPRDRFRPVAMMPIGYPDEEPRPIERIALHRVLSEDHYRGEPLDD